MHRLLILALFLLAAAWCGDICSPAIAQRGKKETIKVDATYVRIEWLMQSGYGPERVVEDGSSINCDDVFLRIDKDANGQLGTDYKRQRYSIPHVGTTLEIANKGEPAHLAIYPDFAGRLHWFGADAVTAKFGGLDLLFIDGNLDGSYAEIGEDFIALGPRGAYAFPITESVPLIDHVYSFKEKRLRGGATLTATRTEFSTTGDSRRMQNALNQVRLDFGLIPTASVPEYDQGCESHCSYMFATGKLEHAEDTKHAAYTEAGAEAARTSLLTTKTTPDGAIKLWLSSLLTAREIRSRWLTIAGFGYKDGYACLRVKALSPKGMELTRAMVFPPNGADNVPVTWSVKQPKDPRPDSSKDPGYPITFCVLWNETFKPRELTCKLLKQAGDNWEDVPVQVIFPASEDYPESMGNLDHTLVLPLEQLSPSTAYRIDAKYSLERGREATVTSVFRTGKGKSALSWDTIQQR